MAEYIDRNALLKDICGNDPSHMEDYYFNAIANAPTADVVEVVRCKDCKYWAEEKDFGMFCSHWGSTLAESQEDDFCSYGERKNPNE